MKDSKLAELAASYEEAQQSIREWEAVRDQLKGKIVEEMRRRDTTGIVTGGYKVTMVTAEVVEYDYDRLKKKLKGKWSLVTREDV